MPSMTSDLNKTEQMRNIGHRMHDMFERWSGDRRLHEIEWLEDWRQYNGIYGPDVEIPKGRSKTFPKLTRIRVVNTVARMMEMMFPIRAQRIGRLRLLGFQILITKICRILLTDYNNRLTDKHSS